MGAIGRGCARVHGGGRGSGVWIEGGGTFRLMNSFTPVPNLIMNATGADDAEYSS